MDFFFHLIFHHTSKIFFNYITIWSNITSTTPGTPKIPTIKEVSQVILSTKPKLAPTKLIKNNTTPPTKALIISLIIIFTGTAIIFKTMYKTISATKKLKYSIFIYLLFIKISYFS